jgi:phosphopantothenoylcysteine synthetase/decarboxylase
MKLKMPKVKPKNLDLIVLNSLRDGAGFGTSNKVTFIDKNFNIEPMELKSKEAVADDILNKVIANFMNKIFTIFLLLSRFYCNQQLNVL